MHFLGHSKGMEPGTEEQVTPAEQVGISCKLFVDAEPILTLLKVHTSPCLLHREIFWVRLCLTLDWHNSYFLRNQQ